MAMQRYDEIKIEISIPSSKASSQIEESEYELAVDNWCEWLREKIESLVDGSLHCDDRPELPQGVKGNCVFPLEPERLPGYRRVLPEWQGSKPESTP